MYTMQLTTTKIKGVNQMSLLKSKTLKGYQIRFKLNGKTIVVTGKTLVDALRKVNTYVSIYL
jgi:hypothetical protein